MKSQLLYACSTSDLGMIQVAKIDGCTCVECGNIGAQKLSIKITSKKENVEKYEGIELSMSAAKMLANVLKNHILEK